MKNVRFGVALLTALAVVGPLIARADLYINKGSGLTLWTYPSRCGKYGTGVRCGGDQRGYLGPVVFYVNGNTTKTCTAKVYYEEYKPLKFRWHVEAVAAGMPPLAPCSYHWDNDNTVEMRS